MISIYIDYLIVFIASVIDMDFIEYTTATIFLIIIRLYVHFSMLPSPFVTGNRQR